MDNTTFEDHNSTLAPPTRDEGLARLEILVQAVIFCLALVGNSVVLIILAIRYVFNYFICSVMNGRRHYLLSISASKSFSQATHIYSFNIGAPIECADTILHVNDHLLANVAIFDDIPAIYEINAVREIL